MVNCVKVVERRHCSAGPGLLIQRRGKHTTERGRGTNLVERAQECEMIIEESRAWQSCVYSFPS